jgi:hypothetical protein
MRKVWYGVITVLMIAILTYTGCSKNKEKDTSKGEKEVSESLEEGENKETAGGPEIKEELESDKGIAFSEPEYFYSKELDIKIILGKPGEVYYTMDGSEPDKEKTHYTKAIKLTAGNDTKATCLKAKAYYEDGTESETIVHTYFVGNDVESRFRTLVFSVTTDPYNLYDYEYGIFVEGKLRDDYIRENPKVTINPDAPANYNMRGRDSEREVHLEIMEPDGTVIADQAAGIRTYGGWSRANRQKSIKIYARKEYEEENNKIRYEFFPEKTSADGQGNALDSFKQLVLRNCGNDNGFAFVRDELFQTLAGQAGFKDYEAVRPVTLFINGEYSGFYWLHEVYGDEYFEDNYGDYSGKFEILEGGETYKKPEEDGDNSKIIEDYEKMYAYSTKDLTDDAVYNELCRQIDVENYLSYYALQIYIGNEDWPHNNYKTYRYYAAEGEEYGEAPFDGKWRYLLHDLDFSFGIYGTGALVDNIGNYIGSNGEIQDSCPLFGRLMQREDCREIFIKKTLDLINGAFEPNNVTSVLDDMNMSRIDELKNMYGKNLMEDWVSFDQLQGRLNDIKLYAKQRAGHILTKYREYFKMGDIYQLTVQPPEGGSIKINSFVTENSFTGSYYPDYNTTVSALLPKDQELDYWIVNGVKTEGEELIVTQAMIEDNQVEVTYVIK